VVKGSLTYRAEVKGFIFTRFGPVDVCVAQAGVEKVVVSCPEESPIALTVTFAAISSEEAARIAGRQICRDLLNRLAVQYCLCIQEPGLPDEAFELVGTGGETVRTAATSATAVMFGKRTVEVDAADLRAELEQLSPTGEVYYDLFRVAMQAQDEVDRFLSLYRILLLCFPRPRDGKEDQKFVDDFIEKNTTERRVHKRPDKPGVLETVYTRLRNEVAHARPGVDLATTRREMEGRVHALAELVRKALLQP
jgi:hypothetical protein